jgi:predicted transcriptional regulator
MRGQGPFAAHVAQTVNLYRKKYGLDNDYPPLSTTAFRRNARDPQMTLF